MGTGINSLHVTLAHRLIEHIRTERLPAGHHLTEQSLEAALGTSRSPIRGALAYLAQKGIVAPQPPRRGLYLTRDAADLGVVDSELTTTTEEQAYLALASDKLAGLLPAVLSENEAMRRYSLTRERMRRVLARAANEGWIEQRASKGWSFLPMIDGPQACQESYDLRLALEPTAMLMPSFAIDSDVLRRIRTQQQSLASGGYRTAGHVEMFQANATFHEALAGLSGNRFIVQTIIRQNQLRRLLEYRETDDRERVRRQCEEHLAILDLLERGERGEAARLLTEHLGNASHEKVLQLSKAATPKAATTNSTLSARPSSATTRK
ncbi:MAG: GntR family transcriptional regulator [Burkholderiaceae bacterium]|nr:GntR family transcriptional regulator [Burkholderiaceae bacterium]